MEQERFLGKIPVSQYKAWEKSRREKKEKRKREPELLGYLIAYNETIDNIVRLIDKLNRASISKEEEARRTEEDYDFGVARGLGIGRALTEDMYEKSARKQKWLPPVPVGIFDRDDCLKQGARWLQTRTGAARQGICVVDIGPSGELLWGQPTKVVV